MSQISRKKKTPPNKVERGVGRYFMRWLENFFHHET